MNDGKNRRVPSSLKQQMDKALCRLATETAYGKSWDALFAVIRLAKVMYPVEPPHRGPQGADNDALACAAIWLAHLAPEPAGAFNTRTAAAKAMLDRSEPAIAALVTGRPGRKPSVKTLAERLGKSEHRSGVVTPEWEHIAEASEWAEEVGLPARPLEDFADLAPANVTFADPSRLHPSERTALRLARLVRDHFDVRPADLAEAVREVLSQLEPRDEAATGCGKFPQK
jgi:hypothetical protein